MTDFLRLLTNKRRRPSKSGWAGKWDRHVWDMPTVRARRRRKRAADLRITLWSTLLAGLLVFNAQQTFGGTSPFYETASARSDSPLAPGWTADDPYRASRESRSLLAAQEGSPQGPAFVGEAARRGTGGGPARIIDGDTFDYGGERIRIADIDTPELRARCPAEAQLATAATARLGTLLAAGPFELKRLGRDEDRYGRKLRVVVRGGRSIGDTLVAEGLARTWTGRRLPWC